MTLIYTKSVHIVINDTHALTTSYAVLKKRVFPLQLIKKHCLLASAANYQYLYSELECFW